MSESTQSDRTETLVLDNLTRAHGSMLLRAVAIHARIGDGDLLAVAEHPEIATRLKDANNPGGDSTASFKEHLKFLQGFVYRHDAPLVESIRENGYLLLGIIEGWDSDGRGTLRIPFERGLAGELVSLLDLHARLGIGQFRVEEHPAIQARLWAAWNAGDGSAISDTIQSVMLRARTVVMPQLTGGIGHSYGIHSQAICDEARVAWDVMQVARHALSWHRHHANGGVGDTWQVSFDQPRRSSQEPLPKAEVVSTVPESHPRP